MNGNGYNNVNHKIEKEVYKQEDWDILADFYQILVDENVLNTQHTDSVVDFKFPAELKVHICS